MPEAKEIKELIEKQGAAWNEYRKTNDELIETKASGQSVVDLNAKLAAIEASFREIEKKAGRPKAGGGETLSEDELAHKKIFGEFLRKGHTEGLDGIQMKAMQSASDPDGGFTILPEMDMAITRVMPTISAIHRLADVRTIGTAQYKKLVKTAGLVMRHVSDGATGGETVSPKYAQIIIDIGTVEVEPWVYNETLADSFVNLESDLANEAAIGFAEGLGVDFISGDGVGKSRGILGYTNVANSAYSWGNVGYIASGASGAFAATAPSDKVIDLQHSLRQQYRHNAVFLTNDSTLAAMRQMKDGSGSYYLWQPDPLGSFGGVFLGHKVEVDDNMPDIGAGSFSLAFGNFKRAYTIVNRSGIILIRDHLTSKGTTKFNFRKRVSAGIVNFEAIKLMKFATS